MSAREGGAADLEYQKTRLAMIAAALWVLCGALGYGWTFATFQDGYPYFAWPDRFGDRGLAVFTGFAGPIGLLIILGMGGYRFGLRYRGISPEDSWRAHQTRWPMLTREDWLRS